VQRTRNNKSGFGFRVPGSEQIAALKRPPQTQNRERANRHHFPLDDPGMWLSLFLSVSASAGV
jgi:hypothetical protein